MDEGTICLKEALEYGINRLSEAKISEAELDAWYLLSHVTKIDRGIYFAEILYQFPSILTQNFRLYKLLFFQRGKRLSGSLLIS